MADADYRAWVEVLPDFKDFNRTVENVVVGGMVGAGTAGGAAGGGAIVAGLGKFAGPLIAVIAGLGIAGAIAGAIRTGVDAGIDYIQTSVASAADLQQSVGAVDAIFKENAATIKAWGEQASEAVGLSKNSYFEFASVVGAQLKNLGIPMGDVAGQTDGLIRLGADLAAQFGGTTSDAVAALSSLLRGERDPIERYGVSIKQADINARLAAAGLSELEGEAKKQAEIQATLAILTEQTADAQGTFAREGETYLNVQQRMNASLEDTAAAFGEELLPVFTEVMLFVKDELIPLWEDFNEEVGPELKKALEEAWPQIKELAEEILPLIPPAIEAIVTGLIVLGDAFITVTEYVTLVMGTFQDLFALLSGDLSVDDFAANFEARFHDLATSLGEVALTIGVQLARIASEVSTWAAKTAENVFNAGRQLVINFANGIRSAISSATSAAQAVMERVAGFFPHSPAKFGPLSGAGWTAIAEAGSAVMEQFESGMTPVAVPLATTITGLTTNLANADIGGPSGPDDRTRLTSDSGVTDVALVRESIRELAVATADLVEARTRTLMRTEAR